jgi:hypothetical protein
MAPQLNALGVPGVYAISYQDEQYNPYTKVGEGTTGQRYASSYMGARSRWWDLSMKQALLEAQEVTRYNQALQREIDMIRDAQYNILQGVPQRYDTIYRHNNTQEQKRREWNASSGPITTTSTRPPGGGRSGGSGANWTINNRVQQLTATATTPTQKAGILEAARQAGNLGEDDNSQNLSAYYAIHQDIEQRRNTLFNQGMEPPQAHAQAEGEILAAYDSTPNGQALVERYNIIKGQQQAELSQRYSSTRTGRDPLPDYVKLGPDGLPVWDDSTGAWMGTAQAYGLQPYRERDVIEPLERRVQELEALRRDPADLIDRTRAIQREKFGPSISQAIRESFTPEAVSDRRAARRARQLQRSPEFDAINRFLQSGGTIDELREMLGAQDVEISPGVQPEPVEVPTVIEWVDESGNRYFYNRDSGEYQYDEVGAGQTITLTNPDGIEAVKQLWRSQNPGADKEPWEEGYVESLQPAAAEPVMGRRIVAPVRTVAPVTREPSRREQRRDARETRRGLRNYGFGMPEEAPVEPPEETEERPRIPEGVEPPDMRGRIPPVDTRKAPPEGVGQFGVNMGTPSVQEHRGNLLAGFTGAAGLLERPKKLDRQTANAEQGSPQQFARAIIDAERAKGVTERRPLQELIGNVAQQYNQMGDTAGRDAAVENTIALYKMFLDEQSLVG